MTDMVFNNSPLTPAHGSVSAYDRRHARAAKSRLRRLSSTAGDMASGTVRQPRIALVFQGSGALGAYQGGVYEALAEADLHPYWIAATSIGAINAALIAGNVLEERVVKLRAFWERVTSKSCYDWSERLFLSETDVVRRWRSRISANLALVGGASPRFPPTWLHLPGTVEAAGAYDGLEATLKQLIDFDRINTAGVRLSVGAVNVRSGDFAHFDTSTHSIGPEHIIASAALHPGFPTVDIEGESYWDEGPISNTPLQWLADSRPHPDTLVFLVDPRNARGELPHTLPNELTRRQKIQFSSRTRAGIGMFKHVQQLPWAMRDLFGKLPRDLQNGLEAHSLRRAGDHKVYNIVHLIDRAGHSKDYDFSRANMHEHWRAGYHDAVRSLHRPEVQNARESRKRLHPRSPHGHIPDAPTWRRQKT